MNIESVAEGFTQFYYGALEKNRQSLAVLYRANSKLTWEKTKLEGETAILNHMVNLPFTQLQFKLGTTDAQPSSLDNNTLLITVTGMLVVDGGELPLAFTQVFVLAKEEPGFYVLNEIFRLNYG